MTILSPLPAAEPALDCALCPRLVDARHACRSEFHNFWNAPVPAFGDPDAWLAIVGLAPGKHGAKAELIDHDEVPEPRHLFGGFKNDGARLKGVLILNAVKCLPPENKPTPEEMRNCRPFLKDALDALPKLTTIIALGQVAHQSAVKACGEKLPKRRFAHGAVHHLLDGRTLIDSYHTSRYNQNTGRITEDMFDEVFALAMGS